MNSLLLLLGVMAWPTSALVIALIFQREVKKALGRVGQVKYHDFEMTFRDDLRQAEALSKTITTSKPAVVLEVKPGETEASGGRIIGGLTPKTPASPPAIASDDRDALGRLAVSAPRDAVIGAWLFVSRALIRAAKIPGDRRAPVPMDAAAALRLLIDRGLIGAHEAQLVNLLRTLRDRAAHPAAHPPSPQEAQRFVDLAIQVATRIVG